MKIHGISKNELVTWYVNIIKNKENALYLQAIKMGALSGLLCVFILIALFLILA
jgi:hypothetical protein